MVHHDAPVISSNLPYDAFYTVRCSKITTQSFLNTFRSLIVVSTLNLLSDVKEFNELVIKTFTTAINKFNAVGTN